MKRTKFTLNVFMYMWHPLPIDLILHPPRYCRRLSYYCSTAADNSTEAAAAGVVANHWPKRTVYRCKNGSGRTVDHTVPL